MSRLQTRLLMFICRAEGFHKQGAAQSLGVHLALLHAVSAPGKACPQLAGGQRAVELTAPWCALCSLATDFFQAFLTATSLRC